MHPESLVLELFLEPIPNIPNFLNPNHMLNTIISPYCHHKLNYLLLFFLFVFFARKMQWYLPLFVHSGLIISVYYISTCNKYNLTFIVPPVLYWIKNTLTFYLEILLWLMVDGIVMDFSILGIWLKSLNKVLAVGFKVHAAVTVTGSII